MKKLRRKLSLKLTSESAELKQSFPIITTESQNREEIFQGSQDFSRNIENPSMDININKEDSMIENENIEEKKAKITNNSVYIPKICIDDIKSEIALNSELQYSEIDMDSNSKRSKNSRRLTPSSLSSLSSDWRFTSNLENFTLPTSESLVKMDEEKEDKKERMKTLKVKGENEHIKQEVSKIFIYLLDIVE